MGEGEVEGIHAVPVVVEACGDFVLAVRLTNHVRIGDVVVFADTSVLCVLHVVEGEDEVCLISLARICSPHGIVEEGGALVLVVAASVDVVELEAEAEALVDVRGKDGAEVVFTVCLVAAGGIEQFRYWRECISEEKLVRLGDEEAVWFEELVTWREIAVGSDARYAR